MNYSEFISKEKSILIAPAGYGKTHALAECIRYTNNNEKQLILTHTHAGIASIKEKLKKLAIPSSKYNIETITGFAQKYTLAFYCQDDIPPQEDSKNYYPIIIKKATELFRKNAVKRILALSYHGIFVDEYQDCTIKQHEMIIALSEILPTHILGDPMQGIFGFNEDIVNFETDLNSFQKVGQLDIPWRWNNDCNNLKLGEALKAIRSILTSNNKTIKLLNFRPVIECHKIIESDIYNYGSNYRVFLNELLLNKKKNPDLNSFLLILPEYYENNIPKGDISARSKLKAQIDYSNQLILLEAIDNKDYYLISKKIDELVRDIVYRRKKIKTLKEEVLIKLFNKSCLDEWISDDRLKAKRAPNIELKNDLEVRINELIGNPSISAFLKIILFLKSEMKFKTKRLDLLNSIIKSMNIAISEDKSVYQSMIYHKNIIRRIGRKINGKCFGTTLLTKGLEFDTVVILNAHRFENYKHFYVAITRACKRLIIFTEKETLSFN